MTRQALLHSYPQMEPPEDEPWAPAEEWHEVWRGAMRIVRSRRRARKLQRRGVPMWDMRERGKRMWLWFIDSGGNE